MDQRSVTRVQELPVRFARRLKHIERVDGWEPSAAHITITIRSTTTIAITITSITIIIGITRPIIGIIITAAVLTSTVTITISDSRFRLRGFLIKGLRNEALSALAVYESHSPVEKLSFLSAVSYSHVG